MSDDNTDGKTFQTISPIKQASKTDCLDLLQKATTLFQGGQLDEAENLCSLILEQDSDYFDARQLIGVILFYKNNHDLALEHFQVCTQLKPNDAQANYFLGNIYLELNQLSEAKNCYQRALNIDPHYTEAYTNLGSAFQIQGRVDDAIACFKKAISIEPNAVNALYNLSAALISHQQYSKAIQTLDTLSNLAPEDPTVYLNRGIAYEKQDNFEEAFDNFQRALELQPNDINIQLQIAQALKNQGRVDDAIEMYRRVFDAGVNDIDLLHLLGVAFMNLNLLEEAEVAFRRRHELKYSLDVPDNADDPLFSATTPSKLIHDIEQIEYLIEQGLISDDFKKDISSYRQVLNELPQIQINQKQLELPLSLRDQISGRYNRLIYKSAAPAIDSGAINPNLSSATIEADYEINEPGITYFDDFLTPEALESLIRFCLSSTIWHEFRYANGYLGAFSDDGFMCPLITQIARELPKALPGIFKDYPINYLWAYKYDNHLAGIKTHADFAAVNVNFWITPDEANLKPGTGGLVLWDKEAPLEWDFEKYNLDQDAIQRFLEQSQAKEITVPYKQNRAVIFNSDLFHKTDDHYFKDGYTNRRINVTFLYGDRSSTQ